jgi:hypothetical protein
MFETFSYLPPLSDDQIARQVDYIVNNGWTPCLEFSEAELAYISSASTGRMGAVTSVSSYCLQIASYRQFCVDLAQLRCSSHTAWDCSIGICCMLALLCLTLPLWFCFAELLRQQVLDNVEAAHVRLHRPRAGGCRSAAAAAVTCSPPSAATQSMALLLRTLLIFSPSQCSGCCTGCHVPGAVGLFCAAHVLGPAATMLNSQATAACSPCWDVSNVKPSRYS